jgi:hypothetical protein
MITFITRQTYDHFERAIPGLQRAITKTSLGESWSIESLANHIVNFEAYAFIQEGSGYAGAFTISQTPLKRSIYFFWSGKDKDNKVPVDYEEVDTFLVAAARHFNCSAIIAEGRKGWERVVAPLGFREDSRVFIKEVSHELPEIQPTASDGREPDGSGQCELPL